MRLQDLPDDVLLRVMGALGCASLVSMGSTCRDFRALAGSCSLRPVMTRNRDTYAFRRWLQLPGVSPRVTTLAIRNVPDWHLGCCQWVRHLRALQSLTVAHVRLSSRVLKHLGHASLRHLDIHRLRPACSDTIFSTEALASLVNLDTLRLTFAPGWHIAVVNGLPPAMSELSIRNAPTMIVQRPPACTRVLKLHTLDRMAVTRPLTRCRALHLHSCEGSVPLRDILPDDDAGLQELWVQCPGQPDTRALGRLTSLRRLYMDVGSFVPDPADLPRSLTSVCVRADAVGISGRAVPRPAALTHVRVELEGAKIDVDRFFFSPPDELGRQDGHDFGAQAGDGGDGHLVA